MGFFALPLANNIPDLIEAAKWNLDNYAEGQTDYLLNFAKSCIDKAVEIQMYQYKVNSIMGIEN